MQEIQFYRHVVPVPLSALIGTSLYETRKIDYLCLAVANTQAVLGCLAVILNLVVFANIITSHAATA